MFDQIGDGEMAKKESGDKNVWERKKMRMLLKMMFESESHK